jgi:hypothetical protein
MAARAGTAEETARGLPVPDDIKIIAQFLAGRDRADAHWTAFTRDAARLRRALKARGQFRLTRGA